MKILEKFEQTPEPINEKINTNFIGKFSIDTMDISFCCLPEEKILNKDLLPESKDVVYRVSKETGEEKSIREVSAALVSKDGLIIYKRIRDVIKLELNSKLLGKNYFDGFNANNLFLLVEAINSDGYLHITVEDLLESIPTNVDIKRDSYCTDVEEYQKSLYYNLKPNRVNSDLVKFLNASKNSGRTLRFGNPNSTAYGKPYFTVYDKSIELASKIQDNYCTTESMINKGFDLYTTNSDGKICLNKEISSLVREEYRIKNKLFFTKILGKELVEYVRPTLADYYKLSQKELEDGYNKVLNCWVNSDIEIPITPKTEKKLDVRNYTPTIIIMHWLARTDTSNLPLEKWANIIREVYNLEDRKYYKVKEYLQKNGDFIK